MTPMGGQASRFTELHLDADELVILKRLLAKTAMTMATPPDGRAYCNPQTVDMAERLYKFRRNREVRIERAFGQGLFADPSWDILLDLFIHHARGVDVSVSSACQGSFSPATTALRHLAELERRGVIVRRAHPSDRRVLHVSLTTEALDVIQSILMDFIQLFAPNSAPAFEDNIPSAH